MIQTISTHVSKNYLLDKNLKIEQVKGKHLKNIWGEQTFNDYIKPNLDKAFSGQEVIVKDKFKFSGNKKSTNITKYSPLLSNNKACSFVVITTINYTKVESKLKQLNQDHLTKAQNKKAFNTKFNKLYKSKKPYSLIYIDLNEFSNINNKLGHKIGDKTLVKCKKIIDKSIRSHQTLYRVGGDEFCIVSNFLSSKASESLASEIVKNFNKSFLKNKYKVGVSVGVINVKNPTRVKNPVDIADKLMYKAKSKKDSFYEIKTF